MAYLGTTAGSTSANPPVHVAGPMTNLNNSAGLTGARLWMMQTTDTAGTIEAANFITDGKQLGMTAGDVLLAIISSAASTTPTMLFAPIVSVTTSGVTLSTGYLSSTYA